MKNAMKAEEKSESQRKRAIIDENPPGEPHPSHDAAEKKREERKVKNEIEEISGTLFEERNFFCWSDMRSFFSLGPNVASQGWISRFGSGGSLWRFLRLIPHGPRGHDLGSFVIRSIGKSIFEGVESQTPIERLESDFRLFFGHMHQRSEELTLLSTEVEKRRR